MPISVTGNRSLAWKASIDEREFHRSIQNMEKDLNGVRQASVKQSQQMTKSFKAAASALATVFSAVAAARLLGQIEAVRAEFQKFEAVLVTALGTKSAAREGMLMISEFASKTPFGITELTEAFVKLVNRGFKPTKAELTAMGDLASSQGKSFDQLTEAILDAQTGEFERLKEFGIRASKEGDRVQLSFKGVTEEVEFTDQAIRNAILSFGEMDGVGGSMEAISRTLGGMKSNLQDLGDQLQNELGKRLQPVLEEGYRTAIKFVEAVKDWVAVPLSEELIKEQAELNVLIGSIVSANTETEIRSSLISELQAKYPEFLANIDAEKASNDELLAALEKVNQQYEKRISLAANQEQLVEVEKRIANEIEAQGDALQLLAQKSGKTATELARLSREELLQLGRDLSGQINEALSLPSGARLPYSVNLDESALNTAIATLANGTERLNELTTERSDLLGAQRIIEEKEFRDRIAQIDTVVARLKLQGGAEGEIKKLLSERANLLEKIGQIGKETTDAAVTTDRQIIESKKSTTRQIEEFEKRVAAIRREHRLEELEGADEELFLTRERYSELLALAGDHADRIKVVYELMAVEIKRIFDKLVIDISAFQVDPKVSPRFADVQKRLNKMLSQNNAKAAEQATETIDDEFESIAETLKDISLLTQDWAGGLSDAVGILATAANSVVAINKGFKQLEQAKATGGLEGFAGAMSGIASLVGGAMGAISAVVNLLDKTQEKEAEYQYQLQNRIKATEAINKALERQLALVNEIYGTGRIEAYGKSIEELKRREEELTESLKGRYQLTGKDADLDQAISLVNAGASVREAAEIVRPGGGKYFFAEEIRENLKEIPGDIEAIQKLADKGLLDEATSADLKSLLEVQQAIKDTGKTLKEELTGTGLEGLIDEMTALFDQGKISAEDFADSFEKVMQRAIVNSFRRQFIEKQMEGFYEVFNELSEDGLTASEIAELQGMWNEMARAGVQGWGQVQQIAGLDFNAPDAQRQGLSGAIRRELTEATGSELAGLYRNQLDITRQQLQADLAAIDHLNAIELNTANTVIELRTAVNRLDQIVTNTKPSQTERDILI